jgi:hypothetical protein
MDHLAEDDALADRQQAVELDEDVVFCRLVLAVHVELADAVDRELLLGELDLVGVGRKLGSKRPDEVGERRREEDVLHRLGQHAAGWRRRVQSAGGASKGQKALLFLPRLTS